MPDRKLFYEDAALERVHTRVVESGEEQGRAWVRLEETVFYPEGGGQPADKGSIAGVRVVDVQPRGAAVVHYLEHALPARDGPVEAVLNGARRFDHRQQHTAQHLLTAVLADRHGRPTTSFHLGERFVDIEVDGPVPTATFLRQVEEEVDALVREDRPVHTRFVEPMVLGSLAVRSRGLPEGHTGPVRLVEIEGIDLNACGGTHVTRLGQIQTIHVLDAEKARGGARIRFLAGGRVLRELRRAEEVESDLKARIGTAPEEFSSVLDAWASDRKILQRRVRDLEQTLASQTGARLAREAGPRLCLWLLLPGAGPEMLHAVAEAALDARPESVVALVGTLPGEGGRAEACFLVQAGAAGPEDVAALGQRLRDRLGAKGGGRGRTYQGNRGALPQGFDLEALCGEP